jgi:hypothetical protein
MVPHPPLSPLPFTQLLFLAFSSVVSANDWVLRPMAIGYTSLRLDQLESIHSVSGNTDPVLIQETSFLGPLEVNEGSNITFGVQLKNVQSTDVTVTLDINNVESDKDSSHKTTFKPVVKFPLDSTSGSLSFTIEKSNLNTHFINIHIPDDVVVNPTKSEEFLIEVSSSLSSLTPLYISLYLKENDVLECQVGYKHKPGNRAIINSNGFKSPDCTACHAGTYSDKVGTDVCSMCPADTFSKIVGLDRKSGCIACISATTTYLDLGSDHEEDCMCKPGTYPQFEHQVPEDEREDSDIVPRPTVVAKCMPCPYGAQCRLPGSQFLNITLGEYSNISRTNNITNPFITGNWYKSSHGYWKIPWEDDIEKKFIKCVDEELCLENDFCQNKSSGVMCQACDNGYYKSGGNCKFDNHFFDDDF